MHVAAQNRSVIQLQWITLAWITIEFSAGIASGLQAHSPALIAFGGDSAIELFSAFVVLRRFYVGDHAEHNATRITAVLLYALAAFICLESALSLAGRFRAEPSYTGIALLIAAALIMPWLGRRKRELSVATCSKALRADAAQSSVCAYMSWIALAGLIINAVFHLAWVDSVAALALLPLVLHEANQARKGQHCC
jgi:divalent metal cation (Fe/Co/Zn/Cd) transporter